MALTAAGQSCGEEAASCGETCKWFEANGAQLQGAAACTTECCDGLKCTALPAPPQQEKWQQDSGVELPDKWFACFDAEAAKVVDAFSAATPSSSHATMLAATLCPVVLLLLAAVFQ
jgi:hypothetical protein